MVKVTSFVIGLIVVSMVMGVISIFMSTLITNYGVTPPQNTSIDSYNKMAELSAHASNLKAEEAKTDTKAGLLETIGDYFGIGWDSLKTTKDSLEIYDSMVEDAQEQAELGDSGIIIRNAAMAIVIVLIIVGVVLAAIVHWEL